VLRLLLQQIDQAVAKADPAMRRLAATPGVGGLTAHAIVTPIGDGKQFASSRDFAAWCGLTPSGLKRRERGISRQGEIRLRKSLALGASTVMRNACSRADRATAWQRGILARCPIKAARSRWRCWHRPPRPPASHGPCTPPAPAVASPPVPPRSSQSSAVLAPSSALRAASGGGLQPGLLAAAEQRRQ
jgi:transposase